MRPSSPFQLFGPMFWKPMVAASHMSEVPMASGMYLPSFLIACRTAMNSAFVTGTLSLSSSKMSLL